MMENINSLVSRNESRSFGPCQHHASLSKLILSCEVVWCNVNKCLDKCPFCCSQGGYVLDCSFANSLAVDIAGETSHSLAEAQVSAAGLPFCRGRRWVCVGPAFSTCDRSCCFITEFFSIFYRLTRLSDREKEKDSSLGFCSPPDRPFSVPPSGCGHWLSWIL